MKSLINQPMIARKARLSNIASVGGLFMLLASVVIPLFWQGYALYANLLLIAGLGISMLGIYYANRWVKKPRPEASLDTTLKSLSNAYQLYHYPSISCDHVLLTPNGVFVLETVNLAGQFTYKKGRWRENMNFGRALRYIVEEHLGDPLKDARLSAVYLEKRLRQVVGEEAHLPVKGVVVFTHPAVRLEVETSPLSVVTLDKLKKQVQLQGPRLEKAVYEQVAAYLESRI